MIGKAGSAVGWGVLVEGVGAHFAGNHPLKGQTFFVFFCFLFFCLKKRAQFEGNTLRNHGETATMLDKLLLRDPALH